MSTQTNQFKLKDRKDNGVFQQRKRGKARSKARKQAQQNKERERTETDK